MNFLYQFSELKINFIKFVFKNKVNQVRADVWEGGENVREKFSDNYFFHICDTIL